VNHRTRWVLAPWVKLSGATRPWLLDWIVSAAGDADPAYAPPVLDIARAARASPFHAVSLCSTVF